MAFNFKKVPTPKIPSPRAKPKGAGKFPHVSPQRLPALKKTVYTKSALRDDPTQYGNSGFGDTGLNETPQLETMGTSYKK